MVKKISAVINTLNEAEKIEELIKSLDWVDEVVVCDMHSDDETATLAKRLKAKVVFHPPTGFVEPARNFAISKASHDWVLVVDADEKLPADLTAKLKEIINQDEVDFVSMPRKNIIFNHWMKASFWWPDYQVRFFKKGAVSWSDKIHSQPETFGKGEKLPALENYAIIHQNYQTISQFIVRVDRYSSVESQQLKESGYQFDWKDLIVQPVNEFLSRYFSNKGYLDGVHGLALSLLQAFAFLVVYLKVWEKEKFIESQPSLKEVEKVGNKLRDDFYYWFKYTGAHNFFLKKFFQKLTGQIE